MGIGFRGCSRSASGQGVWPVRPDQSSRPAAFVLYTSQRALWAAALTLCIGSQVRVYAFDRDWRSGTEPFDFSMPHGAVP